MPAPGTRHLSVRPETEPELPTIWHPSPSFGPRRDGQRPTLIVLHYTAMASAAAALARLCDPEAEVSAHYLIGPDGTCWHMVDEAMRAWHAGEGFWGGQGDVNSRSIGIELDNRGDHPFSHPQIEALARLLRDVMGRWNIPPQGVIGHSDMAPGRKRDPGARFDWQRLAREGLSVWPDPVEVASTPLGTTEALGQALAGFGYPSEPVPSEAVLEAFRQRFALHERADTLGTARNLARRFGVDRAVPLA